MDEFDLLSAVQPSEGWYAVLGIKGDSIRQVLVKTREEVDSHVEAFARQKRDVFFGVAKYATGDNRTKRNVSALQAFWVDLDCGEGKPYPDQAQAIKAVRTFTKVTGLPRPNLVNSGRGLHAYWPLTEPVTRLQWESVADTLQAVCIAQGLHADPSCFEAARILRMPGTLNYKSDPPLPVSVIMGAATAMPFEEFCSTLGVVPPVALEAPTRGKSALALQLQNNIASKFSLIMQGERCAQLTACYADRENLSEPRWFNALSVAKFCADKDKVIHRLSADHPDYDPARTERKIEHILGPATCKEFEKNNPGGCNGCPFKGKLGSPISLGRELIAADEEDNIVTARPARVDADPVTYVIPAYPWPYERGKNGGIYRQPDKSSEETEPTLVFPYDLYPVKRLQDPEQGGVTLFRLHSPRDGVQEFTIPNAKITDAGELRKALSARHVVLGAKQYQLVVDYIIRSFQALFDATEVEKMRTQFGWVDNNTKFIIGDREISAAGTFHSPPSSATEAIAEHMQSNGSFTKWKEIFNLYGTKGMEAHAFFAATAFGAPLLKLSGHNGVLLNVIHPDSGTGKSTILNMCMSVWGNPKWIGGKKEDTHNAKMHKLGVHCHLPMTFDEMSNSLPAEVSELAYGITHGMGKERMEGSTNRLRVNTTTWQTMALCSSNASFYEKLEGLKDTPDGEVMRIMEYYLERNSVLDVELAREMFDKQLMENYGFAGDIYARFLVTHYEEVIVAFAKTQELINAHLNLQPKERFWSAGVAANLTGIRIAIRLGLCDWDLKAIFAWAMEYIESLRRTITPPVSTDKLVIGEFLLTHVQNMLIINDLADKRTHMQELPLRMPSRELFVRYEPDTGRLYVVRSAFRAFCQQRSINYRMAIRTMEKNGMLLTIDQKRITKGTDLAGISVPTLVIDASHGEFFDMSKFENVPEEVCE